ncbi:glycosyltransferase [Slackia isoflavoniconvertens]|uniref:glycosyltransferase n=2 Tax=Eggerthellaceae TaxID=1643826 RepID=UPI003FD8270E
MQTKGTILYVIQSAPRDNAPTKHAFAIADLMRDCGYGVKFLVAGIEPEANDGCDWDYPVAMPESLKLAKWQLITKYHERLTSRRAYAAFKDKAKEVSPAAVIYYGIEAELAAKVSTWCRGCDVPVLVDETDWFEPHFRGDIAAWIVERSRSKRVELVDTLADGVIAISPFFRDYFGRICKEGGKPRVFFLPPLNRSGDSIAKITERASRKRAVTRFFYAGSPAGGKDNLACFIKAIEKLSDAMPSRPVIDVVGVSPEEAENLCAGLSKVNGVHFWGRRSHDRVIEMLRESDFGILFRKPELYARAGFSTKFAECMSNGVPMLCNEVGGADAVLETGVDGIVVPDMSEKSMEDGIKVACSMSDCELMAMKKAALDKALQLFNQEEYRDSFRLYLDALISK